MNTTFIINIESINITLNTATPTEPTQRAVVQEAVQEDLLEAVDPVQQILNKFRLAEKLRAILGNEAANNLLAGVM
ncbi:hypothetical protein [Pseudomonas umsongensis]|uniref:hypothetical protein n=1 Tax=Pseudomonas umsongensis TaxID=198618 RepID=UPI003ECF3023